MPSTCTFHIVLPLTLPHGDHAPRVTLSGEMRKKLLNVTIGIHIFSHVKFPSRELVSYYVTNFEFEFKNKEPTNEDGVHTAYHTTHTRHPYHIFIFIYSLTMIAAAAPPRGRLLPPSADHPWDHESALRILSNMSVDGG